MIINNCATTGCHGANSSSRFILHSNAETNEAATYTNFYILQHYRQPIEKAATNDSVFSKEPTERRLIDRTNPETSLLAQYSLPADSNQVKHPEVPNYRGFLRGKQDPKYALLTTWMGKALVPMTPDYGIDYQLP